MKKIILTGGGTVGHVTLNLLLIPKLIEDGWQVHYIGDPNGIEYQQITGLQLPVTFHGIKTGKLRRYFSWENLKDIFKVGLGVFQSLTIMWKVKPQALFSKGGFVSVPPVVAARLAGVPVFIHESDLSMGLANKIAHKFATTMYTTFEKTGKSPKTKHIGAITKVSKDFAPVENLAELKDIQTCFNPDHPTLLFVGGSGGAKIFNDFITQHKERLLAAYNVINLTGDSSLDEQSPGLFRTAYASNLYQPLLNLADVVITRGGSNTIFELLALQKRHLIVPLGKKASRGDQLENAAYFEEKGYAPSLQEEDLNMEKLEHMVEHLLKNGKSYDQAMARSQEVQSLEGFYQTLLADIGAHHKKKV